MDMMTDNVRDEGSAEPRHQLLDLADEILEAIFLYCSPFDIASLSAVSKRFHALTNQPVLYKLY